MSPSYQIKAIAELRAPRIKAPAGMGTKGRPAKIAKDPIRRYGPRFLRQFADPDVVPNYCEPWPDFVTATTSLSEQMLYAALAIVHGDPAIYWKPPFVGGLRWRYQTNLNGGRLMKGGQVCDFEVDWGGETLCIRLQSERWHVMAEHAKQVADLFNKTNTQGIITKDVYEQDFVGDCSLRAAVIVIKQILQGFESPNPIMFGTARQVRR
jgi:hypothetical protein